MTSSDGGAGAALERELRIDARPEIVFRFLTERDYLLRWQGIEAALDVRTGGEYRIEINDRDVIAGRFIEVTPPTRLVYTWGWLSGGVEGVAPGSTRVDVTLEADGDGTRLRLVHTGLPGGDVAASHGDGWSYFLMRLADVIAGRAPGARTSGGDMSMIAGASARFDERFGAPTPTA